MNPTVFLDLTESRAINRVPLSISGSPEPHGEMLMKMWQAGMSALIVLSASVVARAEDKASKNIVEIAAGNENFSTLVAAVKAAGLVDTLSGEGPFTVFAPTNAAFDKLGKETLDAVLKDKEKLTKILLAHVVKGKVMAADAVGLDGKSAKTAGGAELPVKVTDGKVSIGKANVVKADIMASNGVIHVIDTVIIPD